jgi:hypothetical protein
MTLPYDAAAANAYAYDAAATAGFQDGGPVEPDTPSFMERVAQNAMLAAETFLPSQRLDSTPQQSFQPVDIAATPTPREPVVVTRHLDLGS